MADSRIKHDKMVKAALIVLDHAIHEAQAGPVRASPGARFALSWLYANSTGERGHFSDFVLALADDKRMLSSETARDYVRTTAINTAFRRIMRSVGYPETPEAAHELTTAWQKP